MTLGYRTNVGAILRRSDNLLLMCERITPADTWQFPQGGVDPGESPEDAMWRELSEELGLLTPRDVCALVATGPATHYDFAPDYDAPITREYRGQLQTLYLLDFDGSAADFDLARHHAPEFQSTRWVTPDDALALIWAFKRPVLEVTFSSLASELERGWGSAP